MSKHKRKSPVKHTVKTHLKKQRPVRSYVRGRGQTKPIGVKRRKLETVTIRAHYDLWDVDTYTRERASEEAAAELYSKFEKLEDIADARLVTKKVGYNWSISIVVKAKKDVIPKVKKLFGKHYHFKTVKK